MAYKEINESDIILIDSVSSFIENIKQVKEKKESKEGTSTELYFRGQETEFWDIEPSIFRDDMLSIEHKLMQIPLQKSPTEFRDLNSMFDIMTKYQHYGMCTRLLDLTTNPLVALYFACKKHGLEKYVTKDDGEVEKEPYGVIYYTDKYYPSQSTDLEIQIVSALASYDLEKENTLLDVLERLYHDKIIDKEAKDNWLANYKEFVEIIQNNYMVMPTYTNERLRKQSGVFLLTSLFSFNKEIEVEKSIISKAKGKLKEEFSDECFYISGENKETILKELDLYNINEATLFPELEHQLSYIKYANRNQVNPVTDFTKYEEDSVSAMQDIGTRQPELEQYIIDNFSEEFKEVVGIDDVKEVLNIMAANADAEVIEKSKHQLGQMEVILGNDQTINSLVCDILDHYENNRENLLTGKAMIVAYSRPIAMKIYKRILELRPSWKEKVGVVMTSGNNDPEEWREIIGNKQHKDELAKKFKDNNSPMKIAIVVDMWLTGFDVPSLATMYVYKPMAGHNLMQAIARVNRVFRDKEGGLVVDYVGIASALKQAMNDYTTRDKKNYGDTDVAKVAYPKFLEKLSICKDLFHEYDYSKFTTGSDLERAKTISGAVNFIIARDKEKEKTAFIKESLMLHQALSLCSSLVDEEMRFEAAFFESVRVLVGRWMNAGTDKKISLPEMNARINELLKQSIKSDGVINLFSDIKEEFSLFDPKFLEEIAKMKEKNLAVELLKKLIAEQVHIYKRTNVVKSEKFSEIIHEAMNRYLNGMLTNEQVIEELLNLAKQIAAAQKEGEQLGLTADELAFYDALTKPQAIKDFYENEELIAITKELAETLRKNKTIDWQKRESARAKMRMLIKKLLKKHKYPPEGMEDAVQTVMTQCELWTDNNDMGDEKVINFRSESTSYDDSDYADSMMVAESATTYGARK